MDLYMFLYFFIAVVCLISWYKYSTWNFDYWANQHVLGEKPIFFIGTLKPLWKYGQSFQHQDMNAIKKYGHINGGFIGRIPVLNVSDPDAIRQILLKDFHIFPNHQIVGGANIEFLMSNMLFAMDYENWKLLRNILTPAFTTKKLKEMTYLIEESAQNLLDSFKIEAEMGTPIDLTKTFFYLSLEIIASCAFGVKGESLKNPKNEFTLQAQKLDRVSAKLVYILLVVPKLRWLIPPSLLHSLFSPFHYFAKVAHQTIDQRFTNNDFRRKDLLQLMLVSEDADDTETQIKGKKLLTRDNVVAQSIMILIAGNQTTTAVFSMLAYELALNQDVQEKLIQEIDNAIVDCKGKLTYEIVSPLQYLDMVISETMRKYPPIIRTDRKCVEDYNLNGILLEKGMTVNIPIYAIHHNPEFYPNPDKFDPERFTEENKRKRNPYTFMPFGSGPRNCIGMRFALIELKLVLGHVLHNYSFHICSETEIPMTFHEGLGLLHAKSVKLKVHKRC